jgi:squalene-hopene/tetraprenyl-beta-curcumene cyclase
VFLRGLCSQISVVTSSILAVAKKEAIRMKKAPFQKAALATALVAALVVARGNSGISKPDLIEPRETASYAAAHSDSPAAATASSWDPKAAAAYLDQRAQWWKSWDHAARDHGTFCISCHTAMPYALARPALHKVLGERAPTENERVLIDNVTKRVRLWKEIAPPYSDKEYGANKGNESRGTEAVLLAFVLANTDAQSGKLSADTRTAFDNLWALQQTDGAQKGAWLWQMFGLNPWEGSISPYYGATLAAIAVGTAPEHYRSTPEIQNNMKELRDYLDRGYSAQPLINRVTLLWASAKVPGLLTPERQESITEDVLSKQQADGGWSLFPLARTWKDLGPSALVGKWKRDDGTLQETGSDGFATGIAVFVLQQAGISRDNAQLKRGREWLVRNQNRTEGFWVAYSLNKRRELSSNVGKFMSDAATAFAVLALTN